MNSASARYDWLKRPYGRTFNNIGMPDTEKGREEASRITGASLIQAVLDSGGRVATFDCKSQWYAHHNTTISEKHPELGSRDLLQEQIDAARPHGIAVVPYVPIDADQRAGREHPEWLPVDAAGVVAGHRNGTYFLCENSPFLDFITAYLKELAANYDIDGIFIDGFSIHSAPKHCYCKWCCEGFREMFGAEPPRSRDEDKVLWVNWMVYRGRRLKHIMSRVRNAVHSVKPGLPLLFGACGWYNCSGYELDGDAIEASADLVWHEAAWFWPPASIQYLRAAGNGIPVENYTPAFQYSPSYPLALPLEEIRTRAMTTLANGGIPDFTLHGIRATLRTVNAEIEERAAFCVDLEEIPHCGIVFSQRSMNLCDPSFFSETSHFTTYGILKALMEEKIPEQYLCDRNLETGDLDTFAVIVLPDIGSLSERSAQHLRDYVRNGGGLVAMAETSLYDEYGRQQSDFALSDLFGVHYRGKLAEQTELPPFFGDDRQQISCSNAKALKFLAFADHPIVADPVIRDAIGFQGVPEHLAGMPSDFRLAYPGEMFKVAADEDVEMAVWEGVQDPGTLWPLITTRRYGKGRVVYISANLGFQYCSHVSWPYVRKLIANSVRFARGERQPPCRVRAPLCVQATIFRQKTERRTVVHLLNDPTPAGYPPRTKQSWEGYFKQVDRPREECVPLFNIPVSILGRFTRVRTVPGEDLKSEFTDGYTSVIVPRLDTHLIVSAE